MERRVDAEHDFLVADGMVGVGDLDTHGGSGGLKPDIVVFFCHGDRRIDINGSDDSATMEPVAAYTLEEAGPIVTQGDEYTEVLGSADGCVVAPKAYMKEKNPMYLYSNTYGDVTELPEKVCKILRENKENGSFKDAYLTDDRLNQMASDIYNEYGSTLLYGPVAIPEFNSEVYGFLAADGDNLDDVWYGIWHAPLEDQTFPITKITLFD